MKYKFKIRKSSWGIFINIDLFYEMFNRKSNYSEPIDYFKNLSYCFKTKFHLNGEDLSSQVEKGKIEKIEDKVYLKIDMFPNLSVNKYILQGVRIVSKEINKKVDRDILIVLRKFEIVNTCDFQEEAIPFAVAECLCELFDVDMPKYTVDFSSIDNKYSFTVQ